jgi:HAD superfamily hydrolase (TIGR01509 family)
MIAAVLFDLYETLVTERGTTPVRASSLGERLGLDGAAFRKMWKPQRSRVIRGQVSFADGLAQIGVQFGHAVDPVVVRGLCGERAREKSALFERITPDALAVLRQLHDSGIKLAVVSNCFAEDIQAWPRCAAAPWFDAVVCSFDVGAAKPEREIYLEAARRLGVDPAGAVFIGDGGDDELLGAERAGMRSAQAAWFQGEKPGLPESIPRLATWLAVLELVAAG